MSHLIELRSRLIKALAAFAIAAVFCFFFAKALYNILVWRYVWVAGLDTTNSIYPALLESFIAQLNFSLLGAALIRFPVGAAHIPGLAGPGLLRQGPGGSLPYLV